MEILADIPSKQAQFNAALTRYEHEFIYKRIGPLVSATNVGLQGLLIYLAWPQALGWRGQLLAVALAALAADFINGLMHMVVDNDDRYDTVAGPLIAAFHLHHKVPTYRIRPLPLVYFNESGSKIWLVVFLAGAASLIAAGISPPPFSWFLAYVGIWSSVAEVSHYMCHVPQSGSARWLQRSGLFVSRQHHSLHHSQDNQNYAFLNGLTDPLLNVIARNLYRGYKNTTDQHYG